jgi:hypothetical protein
MENRPKLALDWGSVRGEGERCLRIPSVKLLGRSLYAGAAGALRTCDHRWSIDTCGREAARVETDGEDEKHGTKGAPVDAHGQSSKS